MTDIKLYDGYDNTPQKSATGIPMNHENTDYR